MDSKVSENVKSVIQVGNGKWKTEFYAKTIYVHNERQQS